VKWLHQDRINTNISIILLQEPNRGYYKYRYIIKADNKAVIKPSGTVLQKEYVIKP
jgi:hypothetical protein